MVEEITAHGSGYKIEIDPEAYIGGKIAGSHEPFELPLLEHIHGLNVKGLAVDVGANIGNHTLWLAAICGLRVAAFEPVTTLELLRNVMRNELGGRVKIYGNGLGKEPGRARDRGIRLGTNHDTEAETEYEGWGFCHKLEPQEDGEIEIRTLDSHGLVDVGLIKVDVEGMEADVIRGGEETIRRDRPVIFAEVLNRRLHKELRSVLQPWGYRCRKRFSRGTPLEQWTSRS